MSVLTYNETAAPAQARLTGSLLRLVIGLLLLVPAAYLTYTTLVQPTLGTLAMSRQDIRVIRPSEDVGDFNYARLAGDERYQAALDYTWSLVGRRVIVVAILPLLIALALNEFGRLLRIPTRLLLTLPLALAVPLGFYLAWSLALNPNFGLYTDGPRLAHPEAAPMTLRDLDSVLVFALASGLGVIAYLMALRGTGGKGPRFPRVILPVLVVWVVLTVSSAALTFHTFEMPYILTGGGPALSTSTVGLYMYQQGFQFLRLGYAAAIATIMLVILCGAGLLVGLIVVLSGLRIETVPANKPVGFLRGPFKLIALVVLLATLAGSVWVLWNGLRPVIWAWQIGQGAIESPFPGPQGAPAPIDIAREQIPFDQAVSQTLAATLSPAFAVQMLVTVLAAFGIGAVRPLGRFSEILLLPFSLWLFTGILPFSFYLFMELREAGLINTTVAQQTPFLVNVPILFLLTLFFRGQARQWRARGDQDALAFVRNVVLPVIPLAVLLAAIAAALHMVDVFWPLIVTTERALYTASLWPVLLRAEAGPMSWTSVSGTLALFGPPMFLAAVAVLGLYQIFYFDRLALGSLWSEKVKPAKTGDAEAMV